MRLLAIFALLALTLSASAQSIGGMSGIGGGLGGGSSGGGGGSPCTGALDLSTGCAQLMAIGVLF